MQRLNATRSSRCVPNGAIRVRSSATSKPAFPPTSNTAATTGLEAFDFVNEALPELSLAELDTGVELVGRRLRVPLMIAPMTGGTDEGLAINRRLAALAQRHGLAMGVGSQRIAIERPELMRTYRIRDVAPDIALFANFGGAQLVRGYGVDEARRAVEGIGADALFVHLNALQEAVQGGDRDFRGLADRLTGLCRSLGADGIPVFAREIGFGISADTARRLLECGVAGIDCSGAGGTSWAKVEACCTRRPGPAPAGPALRRVGHSDRAVDHERASGHADPAADCFRRAAQRHRSRPGDRARRRRRCDGTPVPGRGPRGRSSARAAGARHDRRTEGLHVREWRGAGDGPARTAAAAAGLPAPATRPS